MNAQQAKAIDFPSFLASLGHHPKKVAKGGGELWYISPLPGRQAEKTPSFHTTYKNGKWIWKDFGDSEGGNVIDFVMKVEGLDFRSALSFIRNQVQGQLFSNQSRKYSSTPKLPTLPFQQRESSILNAQKRALEFISADPISDKRIIQYLEDTRKIPLSIAKLYFKEVRYKHVGSDKNYFAFGMKNEQGGYEIRSASDQYVFKSALIARDISLVKGQGTLNSTILLFEGMTDFVSSLLLKGVMHVSTDALVMHSVSTLKRTVDIIQQQGYTQVLSFMDNDKTGHQTTARLTEALPNLHVVPQNHLYVNNKDINSAWVSRTSTSQFDLKL